MLYPKVNKACTNSNFYIYFAFFGFFPMRNIL